MLALLASPLRKPDKLGLFSPPLGIFVTVLSKSRISSSKDDLGKGHAFWGAGRLGTSRSFSVSGETKLNSELNAESGSADWVRKVCLAATPNDRGSIVEHIKHVCEGGLGKTDDQWGENSTLLTASSSLSGDPIPGSPASRDTLNLICDKLYGRIPNDPFDPQTGSRVLGH